MKFYTLSGNASGGILILCYSSSTQYLQGIYIFSKYLFNYNSSVYVCLYMCVFDNTDFRRM